VHRFDLKKTLYTARRVFKGKGNTSGRDVSIGIKKVTSILFTNISKN